MSLIKIYASDLTTEIGTVTSVLSCDRTEKINSDNTLAFSMLLSDANTAWINNTNVVKLGDDWFSIAHYQKQQQGGQYPAVSVECEHISYKLNDSAYNVDYFTQTGTPTAILTAILSGTGFTVGTVDFSTVVTFSLQEATSRRALLMQFIAYLGGEALFDGVTVSVLTQRGSATPKDLTANKNITVLSKAVDKRTLDTLGNPTISYECALINPGETISLGDTVILDYALLDIDAELRIVSLTTNPYDLRTVSFEIGNYVNALEDDLYRIETSTVAKDKIYNGTRIGPTYGFEAIRSDNKARSFFRSDGMAIQTGDGTGTTWTNKMWVEVDAETGAATLKFDGVLSASVVEALSAVITPNLYAEKATIAELTVDQLDTGTKVQNYLNENTGDVNYIKIVGQTVQFITASTNGEDDEQATNRNSAELYWTDETHTAATTTVTAYPVMVYVYTEAVKAEISFYDDSGTYIPRLVMGAGTGTGDNDKLIVYKPEDKAIIEYFTDTGSRRAIEMSTGGILGTGLDKCDVYRNAAIVSIGTTEVITATETVTLDVRSKVVIWFSAEVTVSGGAANVTAKTYIGTSPLVYQPTQYCADAQSYVFTYMDYAEALDAGEHDISVKLLTGANSANISVGHAVLTVQAFAQPDDSPPDPVLRFYLLAWGANSTGQIGDGSYTTRTTPVNVSVADLWDKVAAGNSHSLGIKADGTLWAWGWNETGMLGTGDTTNQNVPTQVGISTWAQVSGGQYHSLGIKADGTLWAWGYNSANQLGDGTSTQRLSPVQIGNDLWDKIAAGQNHSLGIKADGTLWAWGGNTYGQLGDSSNSQRSTPVQIGNDLWAQVSAGKNYSLGIKADGTLWAWGRNNYGQLGISSTTNQNVPTQVGISTWAQASAGDDHTLGIKADGTLWAWGANNYGQLGNNDTAQQNSPIQIGSASWTKISAGKGAHSLAIQTNGALYVWGLNNAGQLGLGDTTSRATPTQLGSGTWSIIAAGTAFSMGGVQNI